MAGVRAGLEVDPEPDRLPLAAQAVVLGAGGGARAVVSVLLEAGLARIAVFNRHLHRAEAVVAHFARAARQTDLRALPWHEAIIEAELAKARLVVNASGIGAEPEESPIPADLLAEELYVLDLVLNRAETPLMREAAARGGTVSNGQGSFLVAQAAAFQLWTGDEAPMDVMRTALAAHLGLPEEGSPSSVTERGRPARRAVMFYTSGWVHVICGCMFCGKTDEMLRLLRRFAIAGRQVVLIKPRVDTRTAEESVVSRSGAQHRR